MMRRLELKQIVFVTLVIVTVVFMKFAILSHAQRSYLVNSSTDVKQKYFTSIYIESGETLWNIAESYRDKEYYSSNLEYIKEIKKMNNLKSDKIKQGTYLLVVYYK